MMRVPRFTGIEGSVVIYTRSCLVVHQSSLAFPGRQSSCGGSRDQEIMSLDDQSQKRKERLALLKSAKRKRGGDEAEIIAQEEDEVATKMRYRNYDPETKDAKLGFLATPLKEDEETVEKRAEILAQQTKAESEAAAVSTEPIDIFNLQPKKPNWDLKRDLQRKLERVASQQEAVVAKLVRDRIKALKANGDSSATNDISGTNVNLAKQVELLQREELERVSHAQNDDDI